LVYLGAKPTRADADKIMALLFKGYGERQVGEDVGVSHGTIGNVRREFVKRAREVTVVRAASEYGVEKQVLSLMKLGGLVDESHLKWSEVEEGAVLVGTFKKFEIETKDAKVFAEQVYIECTDQGLSPKNLVSLAKELHGFRSESGKNYRVLIDEERDLAGKVDGLKNDVSRLGEERKKSDVALSTELASATVTREHLGNYVALKKRLEPLGLDVSNLEKAENLLSNVAPLGYDTKKVTDFYSSNKNLEAKYDEVESSIAGLEGEKVEVEKIIQQDKDLIDENRELVSSIQKMRSLHLSEKKLEPLIESTIDISARHGYDTDQAIEKLTNDIRAQYDSKLGYEPEISRLKNRGEKLQEQIQEQEVKLKEIKRSYEEHSDALEAHHELSRRGISDDGLIRWNKILQSRTTSLEQFEKGIAELGGIEAYVESQKTEGRELEAKNIKVKASIFEDGKHLIELESRRKALNESVLKDAEEASKKVKAAISEFDKTFNDPETGLQVWSKNMLTAARIVITMESNEQANEVRSQLEKLSDEIKAHVKSAKDLRKETYEAGKSVGKFKRLEPLLKIIEGSELAEIEATTAMLTLLRDFSNYLKAIGVYQLANPTDGYINIMMRWISNGRSIK